MAGDKLIVALLVLIKLFILLCILSCGIIWAVCPTNDVDPTPRQIIAGLVAVVIILILSTLVMFY